MNDLSIVRRAGAIEQIGKTDLLPLTTDIIIWQATPELIPDLFVEPHLIGSGIVNTGLVPPRVDWPGENNPTTLAVMPPQPQGLPNSISAVQIWDGGAYTRNCTVQINSLTDAQAALPVLAASLTVDAGQLQANLVSDPGSSLQRSYLSSPLRFAGVVLGALGAFCGILVNRYRHGELAAYRFAGVEPVDTRLITFFEQVFLVALYLLSATLSSLVSLCFLHLNPSGLPWTASGAFFWIALALFGAPKLSNPLRLLRSH